MQHTVLKQQTKDMISPPSHIMGSQRERACVWFNPFPNSDKHLGASVTADKQQHGKRACCDNGQAFSYTWLFRLNAAEHNIVKSLKRTTIIGGLCCFRLQLRVHAVWRGEHWLKVRRQIVSLPETSSSQQSLLCCQALLLSNFRI